MKVVKRRNSSTKDQSFWEMQICGRKRWCSAVTVDGGNWNGEGSRQLHQEQQIHARSEATGSAPTRHCPYPMTTMQEHIPSTFCFNSHVMDGPGRSEREADVMVIALLIEVEENHAKQVSKSHSEWGSLSALDHIPLGLLVQHFGVGNVSLTAIAVLSSTLLSFLPIMISVCSSILVRKISWSMTKLYRGAAVLALIGSLSAIT